MENESLLSYYGLKNDGTLRIFDGFNKDGNLCLDLMCPQEKVGICVSCFGGLAKE